MDGFRVAIGGAQEYFGVKADLAWFSKAVANGMPVAILAGRKDVMSDLLRKMFSSSQLSVAKLYHLLQLKQQLMKLKKKMFLLIWLNKVKN